MKRAQNYFGLVIKKTKKLGNFLKIYLISKKINYSKKKKLNLFEQVVRIIKGKYWGKLIFKPS